MEKKMRFRQLLFLTALFIGSSVYSSEGELDQSDKGYFKKISTISKLIRKGTNIANFVSFDMTELMDNLETELVDFNVEQHSNFEAASDEFLELQLKQRNKLLALKDQNSDEYKSFNNFVESSEFEEYKKELKERGLTTNLAIQQYTYQFLAKKSH